MSTTSQSSSGETPARPMSTFTWDDATVLARAVEDLFAFIVAELDPDPAASVTEYLAWPEENLDVLRKAIARHQIGGPADG